MPSGGLNFPEIAAVYARFAALTAMSAEPGGCLLLYSGLDREGITVAMASNVAGAASLGIEPDVERAKQALRAGVCDFVVNTLDEAVRILKNEIRKKRPVSVALAGDMKVTVSEIVSRGVQPEILTFPVKELMERGARLLAADVDDGLTWVSWSVASEPMRWLPGLDALALSSLEIADARVRWVEASPRYLGRVFAGQRYLRMTEAEADAFVAAIREAVKTGAIPVEVSLARVGNTTAIAP
jgi:Urocanase Rossmann-like domain